MVDEESYLPVAVPHDRDAADAEREKASKASFVWIGLAMVVLVVVIIASVVGGLCGSGLCQGGGDGGSQNQTTAPSHRQVQYPQFQEQLQSVFGNGYMSDEDDEHWILAKQALDWIVLEDPSQLEPDDPQMVQRYILALFYMATSQNGPWTDCSPPPKDRPEAMECSYYFDLPGDTNQKRIALRWLSNSSECWWGGIQCSDGIVTELAIGAVLYANVDLASSFVFLFVCILYLTPASIFFFSADNKIEGTLPTEVAMLTHLATLWIAYNKVTILRDTGDAAADLTLSLPTSLTSLMVTRNQFSGTIPTELFGPALRLNRIWLIENLFTGPIPTEIGLFQGFELDLGFNSLSGTLPSEMFTNPNIKWLSIGMNKVRRIPPACVWFVPGRWWHPCLIFSPFLSFPHEIVPRHGDCSAFLALFHLKLALQQASGILLWVQMACQEPFQQSWDCCPIWNSSPCQRRASMERSLRNSILV